MLGPGATASVPPGVVHGFRSLSPARFLNFHTPDGRFAENLRARDRGEEGGFDSFEAAPGSGLPGSDAILLQAGEGEELYGNHRVATIKVGRKELALIEFDLGPSFGGPDIHSHTDHTDAFYVLGGTIEVQIGNERIVAGAGSFAAAPPGVEHTFTSGPEGGRMLNIHAPSTDFHERLRADERGPHTGNVADLTTRVALRGRNGPCAAPRDRPTLESPFFLGAHDELGGRAHVRCPGPRPRHRPRSAGLGARCSARTMRATTLHEASTTVSSTAGPR